MSEPTPTQPLLGVRIIDSADEKGEFCGRLLADLGAEVIRIEPPSGADSRQFAPFAKTPAGEASLYFGLRNAGKRGITLDLEQAEGRALLHRLLERADIWIETSKPGVLEAQGLAPAEVLTRHPQLVMTSLTDHGRTGPYRDFEGTSTTAFAMGGMMHRSGAADRPPCQAPGHLAYDAAGVCAAFPTLMAYYQRLKTGRGQHIDCSVQEAIVAMVDWSIPNGSIGGSVMPRNGPGMYPLFKCQDGYVRMILLVPSHWRAALAWMGTPEELADPKYDQFLERLMNQPLINKHLSAFFSSKQQLDACREGQNLGLPVTPLLEPGQVLDNEHTRARGTFREFDLEPDFPISLPAGFLHLDETRTGPVGGPPRLGQDNAAIYGDELGVSADELASLRGQGII